MQDIIRSMIEAIKPVVKPIPPLEDLDAEQELFLRQNRDLHVRLVEILLFFYIYTYFLFLVILLYRGL